MARIRTIKPEFPQSESMGRVSRDARLLFLMLFTIVDDAGRTRAAPRMLASLLYPYDDDAKTHIMEWMLELERQRCLTLYEVDGNAYLQIEKWLEHQKIDRPSPSRLPPVPPKPRGIIAKPREDTSTDLVPSTLDLGPRTVDQSKSSPQAAAEIPKPAFDLVADLPKHMDRRAKPASKAKVEHDTFPAFYAAYPLHKARPAAAKAYAAALSRASPDVLLAGAVRYAASRQGEDQKFTKHPATWLNQDCWLDEEVTNDNRRKPENAHDRFFAAGKEIIDDLLGTDRQAGEGVDCSDVVEVGRPLLSA